MARARQMTLVVCTLALSWLLMMASHEAGHVMHAWVSGGRVVHVELLPWTISRTDVAPNPHPLVVVWGGPVWGCLIPLSLWLAFRWLRFPLAYLLRFLAGFCFVANGAYLGAAALSGVSGATDTSVMLRHGCPLWIPITFGLLAAGFGLYLWHGLGRYFGLNNADRSVDMAAVGFVLLALIAVVAVELLIHVVFVVGN
jgi:hypothetical protein